MMFTHRLMSKNWYDYEKVWTLCLWSLTPGILYGYSNEHGK
jgi:hypothetical protein